MKRVMVIFLILGIYSFSALADDTCYVGLYASGEYPETSIVNYDSLYQHYDAWVWILPGDDGMKGFEFKIDLQGDACAFYAINPAVTCSMGNPIHDDGWSAVCRECQNEWLWVVKLQLIVSSEKTHSIEIIEYPLSEKIRAVSCLEDYPKVDLIVLDQLLVSSAVNTDAHSWGAVKSMFCTH